MSGVKIKGVYLFVNECCFLVLSLLQTLTTETCTWTAVIIWLCSTVSDPIQIQQVSTLLMSATIAPSLAVTSLINIQLNLHISTKTELRNARICDCCTRVTINCPLSVYWLCFMSWSQSGRRISWKSRSWCWLEDQTMESSLPGSRGQSVVCIDGHKSFIFFWSPDEDLMVENMLCFLLYF